MYRLDAARTKGQIMTPDDVEKFPGGGGRFIHHVRRQVRKKCFYCYRNSTKLCDAPVAGGTCDRPLCDFHAILGPARNVDFCQDHATAK